MTRDLHTPIVALRWTAAAVLRVSAALVVGGSIAPCAIGQEGVQTSENTPPGGNIAAIRRLIEDPGQPEAARLAAIGHLLESSDDPAAASFLEELMSPAAAHRPLVVRAMKGMSRLPAGVLGVLRRSMASASAEEARELIGAASGLRSPEAALWLIEVAENSQDAAVRQAALSQLAHLTGRSSGADVVAWRAWVQSATAGGPAAWYMRQAEILADRDAAQAQSLSKVQSRLADMTRRLYVATAVDVRAALLRELLTDELRALRLVGAEIAERELSSGTVLDGQIAGAMISWLGSSEAGDRLRAARLLDRLNVPEDQRPGVPRALASETDPEVAGALLRLGARWPDAAFKEAALMWLQRESPARGEALRAVLAVRRHGGLELTADVQIVLGVVRALPEGEMTPAACSLLADLGEAEDRDRLAGIMSARVGEAIARSCAEALATHGEYVDEVLAAARNDPALFDAAVTTLASYRATPEGLSIVLRLPAKDGPARRRGVLDVAARLSVGDLSRAAESIEPVELRAEALQRVATIPLDASGDPQGWAQARIALAWALLDTGRAEQALGVVAVNGTSFGPTLDAQVRHVYAIALVVLGRLDAQELTAADPGTWLDGLERCVLADHARAIVDRIESGVRDSFDAAQEVRFEQLVARLQASEPPTEDADESDAGSASADATPGEVDGDG